MCRPGKPYDEIYYSNMENGTTKSPGRPLLEEAAKVAGFQFEDCIQLPATTSLPTEVQDAIDTFMAAIGDRKRQRIAIFAAKQLAAEPDPPKRVKTGGRIRKQK